MFGRSHATWIDDLVLPVLRFSCTRNLIPARKRLLRWLYPIASPTNWDFDISWSGFRYRGNLRSDLDRAVYLMGAYEPYNLRLLADLSRYLRRQRRPVEYLDVGANVGQHALWMAGHADRVIACEPYDVVADRVEQKKLDNKLDHLTLIRCGLGEADESRVFFLPETPHGQTGSFVPTEGAETRELAMRHGDSLLAELGGPAPSIIKIDVEGYEVSVLRGLRQTLRKHRPFVLFEITAATLHDLNEEASLENLFYERVALRRIRRKRNRNAYVLEALDLATLDPRDIFAYVLALPQEDVTPAFSS